VVVQAPSTAITLANHAVVISSTFDPTPNNNASTAATAVLAASVTGTGTGGLPHTGADGALAGPLGALLLVVGAALVVLARRRRS